MILKCAAKIGFQKYRSLIAKVWIEPCDKIAWKMVGVNQKSLWHRVRNGIVWIRDLGRLFYTGFRIKITRWDGSTWSIFFIHDEFSDSENELQYLFFDETPQETFLGTFFTWQVANIVKSLLEQKHLIICDTNYLLVWHIQDTLTVRSFPWLRAYLDTSQSTDDIMKNMTKSRREDVARIKRHPFEFGESRDLTDFDYFHHHLHIPYINMRYGNRATIQEYMGARKTFEAGGQLLTIRLDKCLVAACLGTTQRYGKTFSALVLGIDQNDETLIKKQVLVALYWHMIDWAYEHHIDVVDFGRTRPLLSDGAFNFKRRWGMTFERDITLHSTWTLLVQKNLPIYLIAHLNELGFIAKVDKRYQIVVFDIDNQTPGLTQSELKRRQKMAMGGGIDGLHIINLSTRQSKLKKEVGYSLLS